jgi:superfamily II DNA or RNA helicase
MARLSTADLRVRQLIEKLAPFVAERSVNALCESLNDLLPPGKGQIYPNRIHALLSDDPRRALNETSIALIEQTLDRLLQNRGEPQDVVASNSELASQVRRQWHLSDRSQVAIAEVAQTLGQAPAVVRFILESTGDLPKQSGSFGPLIDSTTAASSRTSPEGSRRPDWSFQDEAVQRCIQSLTLGLNRKIGLVLPTGSGKTRAALRVALSILNQYSVSNAPVLWVTHRTTLRRQAHRELQKMITEGIKGLPKNAVELLARRVEFLMLSELEAKLASDHARPVLLIVDEAHHAAAPSYMPIFECSYPLRGLFLTATPNRTDGLPIGIDEIAYTTTYRELADRGVILVPHFEDFPVPDFDWSAQSVRDLADDIITRAIDDYVKTLVITPRIDRVEEFYGALLARLEQEDGHPLSADDIGFVHSTGNSLLLPSKDGSLVRASTEEFLDHFRSKPRAIIVSAQMLLEGFDDPEINAVVITYPSSSMILLMQAAGRCVRYTPQKKNAFVLQARNDSIAYHLDHRWLYQEISDYLRPQLVDVEYTDLNDLKKTLSSILSEHRIAIPLRNHAIEQLKNITPGTQCRLLLTGLPYYGDVESFVRDAQWSGLLETPQNSQAFRNLFNSFCAIGADLSDPSDFLRKLGVRYSIVPDYTPDSDWRTYTDMLTAMYLAKEEIYRGGSKTSHRPFVNHGATTWLKYLTFHYRPMIAPELALFLQDCYNCDTIIAQYQADPATYVLAIKLPLPIHSSEAYLLDGIQATSFREHLDALRSRLASAERARHFSEVASFTSEVKTAAIPMTVLTRLERFVSEVSYSALTLCLSNRDGASTEAPVDLNDLQRQRTAINDGENP